MYIVRRSYDITKNEDGKEEQQGEEGVEEEETEGTLDLGFMSV